MEIPGVLGLKVTGLQRNSASNAFLSVAPGRMLKEGWMGTAR
jgi:hypothetical protein